MINCKNKCSNVGHYIHVYGRNYMFFIHQPILVILDTRRQPIRFSPPMFITIHYSPEFFYFVNTSVYVSCVQGLPADLRYIYNIWIVYVTFLC